MHTKHFVANDVISFSADDNSSSGYRAGSNRGSGRRLGGGVEGSSAAGAPTGVGGHLAPSHFVRSCSLGGPRVPGGSIPPSAAMQSGLESGFQSSSSLTSISGSHHPSSSSTRCTFHNLFQKLMLISTKNNSLCHFNYLRSSCLVVYFFSFFSSDSVNNNITTNGRPFEKTARAKL